MAIQKINPLKDKNSATTKGFSFSNFQIQKTLTKFVA